MGRKSRSSTQALIGSAPGSTHGSDWSESTLCGDEARNNDRSGWEEPPTWQTLDLQETRPVESGQVYGDVQGPKASPWSHQCHRRSSAPSSPKPMKRFLNDYQKREFFWIDGATTQNEDLEELGENDLLPKLGPWAGDGVGRSKPVKKSSDGFIGELNIDEAEELNEVNDVNELSRTKRRKRKEGSDHKDGEEIIPEEFLPATNDHVPGSPSLSAILRDR